MNSLPSSQTQVVLLRLDPLLKDLLDAVTQFKQLVDKQDDGSGNGDEELFRVIQKVTECLEKIEQSVRVLGVEFAPSLIVLANYIYLALTAVFHVSIQ